MKSLKDFIEEDNKIINSIYNNLSEVFKELIGFEIEKEVRWGLTTSGRSFDIVVRYDRRIVAIFEIKQSKRGVDFAKKSILPYVMSNSIARLFIIFNAQVNEYYIYSLNRQNISDIKTLERTQSFSCVTERIQKIADSSSKVGSNNINKQHIEDGISFYDSSKNELAPGWCRNQLKPFLGDRLCRYSSLDSLFYMLNSQTVWMNGLPGMNDKNEGLFAWNIINNPDSMPTEEMIRRKQLTNNIFIVSLSDKSKIDDLNQWRLYGDDTKGVCCVYSVLSDKIKDRFFLHPVKYIWGNENNHRLRDKLLLNIKKYAKRFDKNCPDFSPVIYFYKPKDYEYEKEVRLLFDNKKTSVYSTSEEERKWQLTKSNNIPNPYIVIQLDQFPLKLEEIILGPNMSDVDTIIAQLETLLKQKNMTATIRTSDRTSYRNPTNK